MTTVLIAVASAVLYLVAYHTYGRWLARKIFQLDPSRPVPSQVHEDGKDYVPSPRSVVFGHHFTSIAGTGPIVGPAIAVFWGWLPALLWVLFGSILIGAVHDFASLVMSLRNQGRTIGDYCGDIINRRVRILFLLIIMFALWIVIAIFGLVIASVFKIFPASVFPVWTQIPIAVALGIWISRGGNLKLGGIVALLLMYLTIWLSSTFPALQFAVLDPGAAAPGGGQTSFGLSHLSGVGFWTILLLIYCYIASILPVQTLLQPRDYINSLQLIVAMGLLFLGLLAARPEMVAPAARLTDATGSAPLLFPFLFITIACGACSGFHCLVSSGVSSKQLKSEGDAQFVGYGSMLLEGMLAVLVIIACTAGLGMGSDKGLLGADAWNGQYGLWQEGLGASLAAFIPGAANMMERIPFVTHDFARAVMGVFVASFAATTLDSTTRLQRYVISELGNSINVRALMNRHVATGIAVLTGLVLAMFDVFRADSLLEGLKTGGKGGLVIWPLFGATNQLLAGLALLVATVWLYRKGKPIWLAALPMVFMLTMTGTGLVLNLRTYLLAEKKDWLLILVGMGVLVLQTWMIVEAATYLWRLRARKAQGIALPELVESA
ncbi:MAG: carbon starvation protein [Candidatus Sumerlaeota bacterium]|nr:carbon starvation protein [Candidatus Sumerlaeota bacterium]